MTKLTSKFIKDAPAGKYGDGDGLQLVLSEPSRGKWVYRFQMAYRAREMGLGDYPTVSITEARERALVARRKARSGIDPIDERRKVNTLVPTFGAFAEGVIEAQTVGVGDKHAAQWRTSLATYATQIKDKRVDAIATDDVLGILKPIWTSKPETAGRVRNRIERILDAATARKLRDGSNPARWKGHLDKLLPKPPRSDRHHAAMDYADVPAFVARLRERDGVAERAIEFIILNAVRLSEAIEATWGEFDLDAKLWVIPGDRMKSGREHRVPLSERACQILTEMAKVRRGDRVFNVAPRTMQNAMKRLDASVKRLDAAVTLHGMRSSFRDWAGDVAHAPREIAEAVLAHTVGNQTERAYRRGDALEQRRKLMDAWAGYCAATPGANIVAFPANRSA
jgi:integrase